MLRVCPASLGALLTVFSLSVNAAPAPAAPSPIKKGTRLVVVELTTPPTMMGLGGQVLAELTKSAAALGYTVIGPEDLAAQLGPGNYEALQKCNGQQACVMTRVRAVNPERVVTGSLTRTEKDYLLKLKLIDAASGQVISDVDRNILIASRRFRADVEEAVPRLLRGEREARGAVKIVSNVKNATVWVDGEVAGKAPVELQLKPGKYEVRLEKKSYLASKRLITVEANAESEEEFRLILEPGAVAEEDELPPLAATNPAEGTGPRGIRVTPPAWVAFGAAAVTAGVGGYFGYRTRAAEETMLQSLDATTNLYGGTRAQALQGKQDAKTANILYGAAGIVAAAGVLFTVLDVGGDGAPVTATPSAGPGGAGVLVEGRF